MSPKEGASKVPATFSALGIIATIAGVGWTAGWAPVRADVADLKRDQDAVEDVVVDIRTEISEIRRSQRADSVRAARVECVVTALARKRDPVAECDL